MAQPDAASTKPSATPPLAGRFNMPVAPDAWPRSLPQQGRDARARSSGLTIFGIPNARAGGQWPARAERGPGGAQDRTTGPRRTGPKRPKGRVEEAPRTFPVTVPPCSLWSKGGSSLSSPFGLRVAPAPALDCLGPTLSATAFGSGRRRAERDAARAEREAAKVAAAAAEGEVKGLRLALEEARRPFWRRWLGP